MFGDKSPSYAWRVKPQRRSVSAPGEWEGLFITDPGVDPDGSFHVAGTQISDKSRPNVGRGPARGDRQVVDKHDRDASRDAR